MFRFRRIHIPTQESWDVDLSCAVADIYHIYSIESFHKLLIRWNGMDPSKWAYAPIE